MEVTACSFGMANGSTMSGTAPLGICWFIESVLRHQWQRACVLSAVLITTSAPHAVHLKVSTSSLEGMMSTAPEAISTPVSRSEERRVGKECRSRGPPDQQRNEGGERSGRATKRSPYTERSED